MTNTRAVLAATVAAVSLFALSACGGGEDAPDPAGATVATQEGGGSDGGGGIVDAPEDTAEEEGGFVSTGSPLGDMNREAYVASGYTPDDLAGIAWAGDVSTQDGSFVEYPDGLRVEFVEVVPGSAPVSEQEGALDPDKTLVRVSLAVTNGGEVALPVDGDYAPFRVYEGANLTEVSSHVGYFGEEDDLYPADDASMIAPGAELEVYRSFEVVPGAALEVELNPDFFGGEHTPFVFYGIAAP